MLHAGHKRSGYNLGRRWVFCQCLLQISCKKSIVAILQGELQPVFQAHFLTRGACYRPAAGFLLYIEAGSSFDEPFSGVRPAAKNCIFKQFEQFGRDV